MSERVTVADFDRMAQRFARAYTAAGMGQRDIVGGSDIPGGVFRPTGLDLIFERPTAYTGGGVWVTPWHNPLHPARWSGASAHGTSVVLGRFGGTLREAVATLRTASEVLEAVTDRYGIAPRVSEHPDDVEAMAYLDARRDEQTARDLDALRRRGVID